MKLAQSLKSLIGVGVKGLVWNRNLIKSATHSLLTQSEKVTREGTLSKHNLIAFLPRDS